MICHWHGILYIVQDTITVRVMMPMEEGGKPSESTDTVILSEMATPTTKGTQK